MRILRKARDVEKRALAGENFLQLLCSVKHSWVIKSWELLMLTIWSHTAVHFTCINVVVARCKYMYHINRAVNSGLSLRAGVQGFPPGTFILK